MKRKIFISCIMMLVLFTPVPIHALDININGKNVIFDGTSGSPLIDSSGRALVPLRATMEAAGASVNWDAATKIATVKKNDIIVSVPVGQAYIVVNGKTVQNDSAAVIIGGKVYLPIRAVLEALDFTVEWSSTAKTVFASDHDVVTDWVPYSTGDLTSLLRAIAEGDVVYYNGQYWASPDFVNSILNLNQDDFSAPTDGHSTLSPDSEYTTID